MKNKKKLSKISLIFSNNKIKIIQELLKEYGADTDITTDVITDSDWSLFEA